MEYKKYQIDVDSTNLGILSLLMFMVSLAFLVRNLFFSFNYPSYWSIILVYRVLYFYMTLLSLLFRLFLRKIEKLNITVKDIILMGYITLAFLFCTSLSALDSMEAMNLNMSAYVAGIFMVILVYRANLLRIIIIHSLGLAVFFIWARIYWEKDFDPYKIFPLIMFVLAGIFFSFHRHKSLIKILILKKELEEKNRQLEEISMKDYLTGLHNRRFFMEFIQHSVSLFERNKTPFVIAFIDADDFKNINDYYGHETGDKALKIMAEILKNTIRASDLVVRFGGEEFLVFLHDITLEAARELCERLRENISSGTEESLPKHITVSIGLSGFREGDSIDTIIARADKYMYQVKKSGKNRVFCGDSENLDPDLNPPE